MTPVRPIWQTESYALTVRDILLQLAQVLATLLLAPLLQGVILQFELRVRLGQGPGVFQPDRCN
jgi:formate hydrogenlyase subunit 4